MDEKERLNALCPTLLKRVGDEDLDERRFFVVVDPNVEEEADEAEVVDPTEYNWMAYIPDRVREAVGEERFGKLPGLLREVEEFADVLDAEEDLFGIRCDLDEEAIAERILEVLERLALEAEEGA
ncbi:hypothetical protein [Nitratifractor sp.]